MVALATNIADRADLEQEPHDDRRFASGKTITGLRPELAGLRPRHEASCPRSGTVPDRPLDIAWISDELLAKTRTVWSKEYGRVISESEAIEILVNVKRLAEVLLGPQWRKSSHERDHLDARVVA